ncbi:alpha-amylase family glycosyl hydrolase [Bacillus sp. mrc49]|uniref:alpha-amylase family glycosyl hydrolase n=1 Tax=Bacillus sp. mrc49 TaxID=2054913 RepID=UPI000C27B79C|nr:alpha-amylase family glycosyl hydrolase [Bacillus sp. mrc49]PJN86758.1 alpha-amlyase [Bacillus sp. mrc49]
MRNGVLSLALIPLLLFYAIPVGAAEKEQRTWTDEIVYSLMVDRFFDGNTKNNGDANVNDPSAFNGGDFEGVTKKLNYLKDMGYTAIILSPIFANEDKGYHGDWVTDFYKTDQHYGTMKEFKKLVNEAHDLDMKVILDFQANNVGPHSSWLNEEDKQGWFHDKKEISNDGDQKLMETGWHDGLPDLNQDNEATREYLLDAAKWWITETDIDGYRLNKVQYVGEDFWKEFVDAVKSEKSNFYTIGDVNGDADTISSYKETGIDAFMAYPQNGALREAFSAPDKELKPVFNAFEDSEAKFGGKAPQALFMDTQGMPRFTKDAADHNENPGSRWKMALSYLYTMPGVPIVFYGSEIALNGNLAPDNHKLMNFKTEQELVEYITKLSDLRDMHPALTKGDMEILYEQGGASVFKRVYGKETMVVVMNNTSGTKTIKLSDKQLEKNKELRGMLNGDLVRSKDNSYTIVIDRETTEVYTLSPKSIINIPYLIVIGLVLVIFAIFIALVIKRSKRNQPK